MIEKLRNREADSFMSMISWLLQDLNLGLPDSLLFSEQKLMNRLT